MDYTRIKCLRCPDQIMKGAGAQIGGRSDIVKVRCPECDLTLMIIPMHDKYEYSIKITTEEERIVKRIQKARDESELELAKTITRIKETGY